MNAKVKGYVQGLRWSGINEFLFDVSGVYHVDLTILKEDKGILRTTIYYQVEGEEQAVQRFRAALRKTMEEYNKITS